jgi:predicted TPR repeat methyltransferase
LGPVVRAAAGALRAGGRLIFTLERVVRAAEDVDYRLEFHGRYAHSRAYVERILAAAGLRSQIAEADLRMESGLPVAGLVVRAAKV